MNKILKILGKLFLVSVVLGALIIGYSFYRILYVLPVEAKEWCVSIVNEYESGHFEFREKYSAFRNQQRLYICPENDECGVARFNLRDDGLYTCNYMSSGGIASDYTEYRSETLSNTD